MALIIMGHVTSKCPYENAIKVFKNDPTCSNITRSITLFQDQENQCFIRDMLHNKFNIYFGWFSNVTEFSFECNSEGPKLKYCYRHYSCY